MYFSRSQLNNSPRIYKKMLTAALIIAAWTPTPNLLNHSIFSLFIAPSSPNAKTVIQLI